MSSCYDNNESRWMVGRAREELELLELQHPNRFNFLKSELHSIISHPNPTYHHQQLFCSLFDDNSDDDAFIGDPLITSCSASTQVSSNRKRWCENEVKWQSNDGKVSKFKMGDESEKSVKNGDHDEVSKLKMGDESERSLKKGGHDGESRVERVMRRAEACLDRIKKVKAELCPLANANLHLTCHA